MSTQEKFGKYSDQYKDNQKLLARLADPTDKEIGKAMCQRCERVFGHSGYVRQLFTCNDCFMSLESERFFVGNFRTGWNPWRSTDHA